MPHRASCCRTVGSRKWQVEYQGRRDEAHQAGAGGCRFQSLDVCRLMVSPFRPPSLLLRGGAALLAMGRCPALRASGRRRAFGLAPPLQPRRTAQSRSSTRSTTASAGLPEVAGDHERQAQVPQVRRSCASSSCRPSGTRPPRRPGAQSGAGADPVEGGFRKYAISSVGARVAIMQV